MREPFVFVQGKYFVWIACMVWVWFVVQISPRAIRIEGQPCEHVPSGSTTHPSEQQAGDVDSQIALRVNCSRVSGVNPSFSRASVALIRYGLWDLTFMICKGINCPWNLPFPIGSPGNSSFDEVNSTRPVGRDVD